MSALSNKPECTRFEKEALILIEQGQPLDEHFDTCGTCIEERRKYNTLIQALSATTEAVPNDDWQQNVLNAVTQQEPAAVKQNQQWGKRNWYNAIAACLAIVAIPTVFITQYSGIPTLEAGIEMALISGDTVYRSTDAKVGDKLQLKARAKAADTAALRVYRDGRIHYSCGLLTACNVDKGVIIADVSLTALGEYQTVLFQPASKLSAQTTTLDQDVLFARDNELEVTLSETIIVR